MGKIEKRNNNTTKRRKKTEPENENRKNEKKNKGKHRVGRPCSHLSEQNAGNPFIPMCFWGAAQ
jgi:hypothetical protein